MALSKSVNFIFKKSHSTAALSFPRFTCALMTPFRFNNDFSIVATHIAQVIPEILSSVFFLCSKAIIPSSWITKLYFFKNTNFYGGHLPHIDLNKAVLK